MFFTNNHRIEHTRRGFKWIHSRVNTLFSDRTVKRRGRIQVSERRCRCRIGQIVGRNVNCLNRGNRTLGRRGDAFLHLAHVGCQRWLITHCGRNTAQKCREFRTSLGEAEDVVHEEQNVLALVTEVFSNRQTRQGNASARTRRLVHLTVNECGLGAFTATELVNARFDHFVVKVVTFTGTFTNACEYGVTAVRFSNVVDQFHDQNGLANACAAEQTDLTTLCVRSEKVNNLNARYEDFSFGRLFDILRSFLVNRATCSRFDRTSFVNRLTDNVHDTAERFFANRNHDRVARVAHFVAANQTFGRVHSNRANSVFAQMLCNFKNQTAAQVVGFQSVEDQRELTFFELYVDNSADDLSDLAHCTGRSCLRSGSCLSWSSLGWSLFGWSFGRCWLRFGRGGSFRGRCFCHRSFTFR